MLIFALMDRWQLKTNKFHLSFNKMSITLEDVSRRLHIPLIGKVVECKALS
ncbi:hypothetical protein Scep_027735 [Stephania cephalantha]|uniref:Aminotransferase-like plant mobile domain-containing protein n=1 Tax=Stephania cephalantha TaxID=152367 RepID=A0AAP0EBS2_9MAGN